MKSGYVGVDGVARQYFSGGRTLREYAEGDIVYINESGSPVAFYVGKHNYESGLNGAGRTLLVRKPYADLDKMIWNSSSNVTFPNSSILYWLNTSYFSRFSTKIQQLIPTTTYQCVTDTQTLTVGTTSSKVFLLSITETGCNVPQSNQNYAPTEGSVLPISSVLRGAYMDAEHPEYWTRTVYSVWNVVYVNVWGGFYNIGPDSKYAPRPCFTLPSTTEFNSETNQFIE